MGTLTCKKGLELELGVCDKTRQSGSLLKDLNTCLRVIYERGVDEPYLMSDIFQKANVKVAVKKRYVMNLQCMFRHEICPKIYTAGFSG